MPRPRVLLGLAKKRAGITAEMRFSLSNTDLRRHTAGDENDRLMALRADQEADAIPNRR